MNLIQRLLPWYNAEEEMKKAQKTDKVVAEARTVELKILHMAHSSAAAGEALREVRRERR